MYTEWLGLHVEDWHWGHGAADRWSANCRSRSRGCRHKQEKLASAFHCVSGLHSLPGESVLSICSSVVTWLKHKHLQFFV